MQLWGPGASGQRSSQPVCSIFLRDAYSGVRIDVGGTYVIEVRMAVDDMSNRLQGRGTDCLQDEVAHRRRCIYDNHTIARRHEHRIVATGADPENPRLDFFKQKPFGPGYPAPRALRHRG